MAYTLGGVSLGRVQNENHTYQASLMPITLYGNTGSGTAVAEVGGVEHKITIEGKYVSPTPTIAETWAFVSALSALLNGQQDTFNGYPISLVSDLSGTTKVKVESFIPNVNIPGFLVEYTIVLIEAGTVL